LRDNHINIDKEMGNSYVSYSDIENDSDRPDFRHYNYCRASVLEDREGERSVALYEGDSKFPVAVVTDPSRKINDEDRYYNVFAINGKVSTTETVHPEISFKVESVTPTQDAKLNRIHTGLSAVPDVVIPSDVSLNVGQRYSAAFRYNKNSEKIVTRLIDEQCKTIYSE